MRSVHNKSCGSLDLNTILLRTRQDGGILKYPDLIWIVREEEAMLLNKKESQKPESVVGIRMVSAADGNPQVELLKTHH